jgi:hypothetical protein
MCAHSYGSEKWPRISCMQACIMCVGICMLVAAYHLRQLNVCTCACVYLYSDGGLLRLIGDIDPGVVCAYIHTYTCDLLRCIDDIDLGMVCAYIHTHIRTHIYRRSPAIYRWYRPANGANVSSSGECSVALAHIHMLVYLFMCVYIHTYIHIHIWWMSVLAVSAQ